MIATLCLLVGCSASGDSAGESSSADAPVAEGGGAMPEAVAGGTADDSAGGGDESLDLGGAVDADRQFITTGSVSMAVADPSEAAAQTARLVESVGGHVQELHVRGDGGVIEGDEGEGSASLVVRVPSAQVAPTLDRLAELGEVVETSIGSTEVTTEVRDLEARIRALQISIGRLEDLLGRAGSISDVVEAEGVLTDRQADLEVLLSRQASLAEQVVMATLEVQLWPEGAAPERTGTGFVVGLVAGWTALLATLTGLLQALGAVLPWLVFAGLVTAAGVAVLRWWRRRHPRHVGHDTRGAATVPLAVPPPAGASGAPAEPPVTPAGAPGAGPVPAERAGPTG